MCVYEHTICVYMCMCVLHNWYPHLSISQLSVMSETHMTLITLQELRVMWESWRDMTVNLLRDKTHVCVRQYTATHTTHCNTLASHMYPRQASKQDSQLRWHDCQLHTWQDPCIYSTIYTHIHTVDMYLQCTYCIMTLNFIRDRTHVYVL